NWTELQSNDVESDLTWLTQTFGFETDEMPTPDGGTYYMLKAGGKPRGGLCAAFKPEVAGRWLNWVQVADVDDAIGRARAEGGTAVTDPSDYPGVGRMAIAKDPSGAVFGVITPTAQ
ncbi:MAG: VOC family protein, partial [Longimicrobiales bacterium]